MRDASMENSRYKFRAWNGEKMIPCEDFWLSADGHTAQFGNDGNIYFTHHKLMQYTGLKDKNGNDLYEGDIVEYISVQNNKYYGEVKWNPFDNMAGFQTPSPFINIFKSDQIEIIGNIFESQELLGEE